MVSVLLSYFQQTGYIHERRQDFLNYCVILIPTGWGITKVSKVRLNQKPKVRILQTLILTVVKVSPNEYRMYIKYKNISQNILLSKTDSV